MTVFGQVKVFGLKILPARFEADQSKIAQNETVKDELTGSHIFKRGMKGFKFSMDFELAPFLLLLLKYHANTCYKN